jgi:uncharacterized protein (DUF1778 family)
LPGFASFGYGARMRKPILLAVGLAVAALAAFAWPTDFMTDAATRLARDLREGADRLNASGAATRTVVHRMKATPEGCADSYRVQLTAASAIVVWCRSPDGQQTVGSHATTSHLPAVEVRQTWILDKGAGEPLTIELAATGGKPSIIRAW